MVKVGNIILHFRVEEDPADEKDMEKRCRTGSWVSSSLKKKKHKYKSKHRKRRKYYSSSSESKSESSSSESSYAVIELEHKQGKIHCFHVEVKYKHNHPEDYA